MPASTALKGRNSLFEMRAIICARVVFPTPGRSPENKRGKLIALDLRAQGFAGTEDMLLPREAVERIGPHAFGERPFDVQRSVAQRARVEETHCSRAWWTRWRRDS